MNELSDDLDRCEHHLRAVLDQISRFRAALGDDITQAPLTGPAEPQEQPDLTGMTFGEKIQVLRAVKGWTQTRLAQETGLSVNGISRIESDIGDPRLGTRQKLAWALGVRLRELLPPKEK